MYKITLLVLTSFLFSSTIAAPIKEQDALEKIFSKKILTLNFPNGLPIDSMAHITNKNGYKIYFDDNIDTSLSIPQANTKISSLDLFKTYIKKFNLKYKTEHDFLIRIYKDENHKNKVPYSYSSFFYVSQEKYGCYTKIHDLMGQYDMKLKMQDYVDQNIENYGLNVIPINVVYNNNRVNFTCISKDGNEEFLSLTITGFDYPEIISQSVLFKNELTN